ncbi:GNAT family N-acetyltransferase [Paenibacillus glycinis]|uniref:GNAT family N-acetyltransferase n=1 Tax=Paenibacillus glycinis TaxID=2697035 RepID=A0ABW9XKW4_9BACL|nr:GNAT family N-acetyltransferase [Paenibacillus glycinis]NBD23250.1 GNAT family N-acetyltransferase [Paenibacillus glycinis]
MIRPTESLALPDLSDFVRVDPDERKPLRAIVALKKAAYRGGLDEDAPEAYLKDTFYCFEHQRRQELNHASSIVFQEATNEFAGYCLVSLWEELPLIYDVAVHPDFRRHGLGRYMLRRAIGALEPFFPVIRLFVTAGNEAEHLYAGLGFLSGDEYAHLVYENDYEKERTT